ncbi:polysaccharide biosynthesis tyrosine autokinase [Myceligenerans salitolerans]|uniref:non-specific protein-tyrosine kinase n=1 Tax=Myceligenerans salitolerans TaxID=1230528 RepID=A0ABS3ID15_9MICO|nr:polysaccharide biosynthesis tyrosine autokinase [Myceligenerans salitolerans]MBO0610927.1 polysaccharide biosynthesis tyrosine autokinase [Myceligenerans salitolerans]
MELSQCIALLRKRWPWFVAFTVAGVAAFGVMTYFTTPVYEARAQVFVSLRSSDNTVELMQGGNYTAKQVASYTELVTSPRVLDPVIDELGLDESAGSLAARIQADTPKDTVLINIVVSGEVPTEAAEIADATAQSLSDLVTEIEQPQEGGDSPVELSVVREAAVPTSLVLPNTRLNLLLGGMIGLVVGFGVVLLRERLDTRIRSHEDLRTVTDASVIGMVTYDEHAPDHPLIVEESPQSPRAEALRRVRTNLQFITLDAERRTLVMTSAIPGEGKSTTSINLAITMADAGSRVLLVDADLRRPSVSKYMGLEATVGLTTVLIGRIEFPGAIQPWGNKNLHVLPSGVIPPNPSELLGSARMTELLDQLAAEYDVVIVDTAPLLPVTDAALLARIAGGAVVVVGAGTVHRLQLAEAIYTLETVGAPVHGIVLNRMPADERSGDSYRYYEYEPETPEGPPKGRIGLRQRGIWPGPKPDLPKHRRSGVDSDQRRPPEDHPAQDHGSDLAPASSGMSALEQSGDPTMEQKV